MAPMTPEQKAMLTHNPEQLIDDIDITEDHAAVGRLVQESMSFWKDKNASGFSRHKGDLMLHINGEINIRTLEDLIRNFKQ